MNETWKAVLVGAIQGLTEFLPVSSSAHLIAAKAIFGYQAALAFDVVLHLATLLAVVTYLRRDLVRLLGASERWAVFFRVILGTIPAAAIAMAFRGMREDVSPWLAVGGWTVSAAYLVWGGRREGNRTHPELPPARAFLVGSTQGIAAIVPGISRSGASITSGLWLGLRREEAFRFSFLLAIPLMLGASLVEGRHLLKPEGLAVPGGWPALILAMAAAFFLGLLALHLLLKVVTGRQFHRFGWYNLLAALAFAIYLSSR